MLQRHSHHGHQLLAQLSSLLATPREHRRPPAAEPKQRQNHLDKPSQIKVVEAYQQGQSVYAIARQFGVTRQTVAAILERHGIKRRYKILTTADIDRAKRLYEKGASLSLVANEFGVNPSTIRYALLGAGVQTRPNGTNQWT